MIWPAVPRILAAADSAVLVEFEGDRDEAGRHALTLAAGIAERPVRGVVGTVPGLRSLLVEYDSRITAHRAVVAGVRRRLAGVAPTLRNRRWQIPVCTDRDMAPDLVTVARHCDRSPDQVVTALISAALRVAIVGNLPGLPYLVGLPSELEVPRRADPRERVVAGSVALAAGMACIYPLDAPGGWNVVGRTPARLFDAGWTVPALLAPGDQVSLAPIGAERFAELDAAARSGRWSPAPTWPQG